MFALKWISQETGMPSQPAWAYKQSKSLVKKDNDDNLAIKVLIMVIGWLLIISGKCNRLENTGYWCDRRPLKSKKRNIVMITLLIWLVQIGWCLHMFLAWSHTHLQCQVLSLLIAAEEGWLRNIWEHTSQKCFLKFFTFCNWLEITAHTFLPHWWNSYSSRFLGPIHEVSRSGNLLIWYFWVLKCLVTENRYDIISFFLYFSELQTSLACVQNLSFSVAIHSSTVSKIKKTTEDILSYIFQPPTDIHISASKSKRCNHPLVVLETLEKILYLNPWYEILGGSNFWCLPI